MSSLVGFRFALRSMLFALLACLAFVTATPAAAQSANPPANPPTGSEGCAWYDASCMIFGNPENLEGNISAARAKVAAAGCWSCTVFNSFSQLAFSSAERASAQGDAALRPLIVAIATLFALFYLGSAFVSGDASDLLGRWKVFWKLCIAVALGTGWMAAGSYNTTWKYVYGPLMSIPLAVEQSVPGGYGGAGGCEARAPANAPDGAGAALNGMAGVVCGAHDIAVEGISFGIGLANTGNGFSGFFVNGVTGIILAIVFGWIAITFPLKFIDVLIRLLVVGVATPVLVVCAVFKPTRGYVQIGIRNVLYAGCLFAVTGIMFKLGWTFMQQVMRQTGVSATNNTMGQLSSTDLLGSGIVLIGCGVIFSAMIKMAPSIAAEFSQFSGSAGGVGDAATAFTSTVVTAPIKGAGLAAGGVGAKMAMSRGMSAATSAVAKGAEAGAQKGTGAALKGMTQPGS